MSKSNMDLNWIKLSGYKRFENATLNASGKVVAIVGPNEAGKSSLLQALEHLNHDNEFTPQELTRDQEIQDNAVILEAGFILDDNDRQAISHLSGGYQVRWLYIRKLKNGTKRYQIPLSPLSLQSAPTLRSQTVKVLSILFSRNILKEPIVLIQILEELSSVAKEINEPIEQILLQKLKSFKENLEHLTVRIRGTSKKYIRDSIESLDILIEHETISEKNKKVIEILKERIPKILGFDERQRNLSKIYNIAEEVKMLNAAFQNLINLAHLDIKSLNDAITKNQQNKVATLIDRANQNISEVILDKWLQSKIKVNLRVNQTMLYIFIKDEQGELINLDERSDGLRQFIALINFLESQHTENNLSKPILLIDEAEIHLHYDAQADLMKMFAKQQLVSKIIYTTHSAGCLPEDIGVGVKVVEPIPGQERSKINNAFWNDSEKRFGFAPLLFGMGGSTLAYIPIRKAVFVEGITDLILLPTLFRQVTKKVTKKDYLGFQVIPGLSKVSPQGVCLIENHAPSSVFLFDADQAGDQYIKDFQKYGINEFRLFHLPLGDSGKVLEDAVKEDLYLEAVKKEIQKRYKDLNRPISQITLSDISGKNRPTLVKQWCKSQGIANPEKREIAYHLIELSIERQETLLRPELEEPFQELYAKILESLELQIDIEC